MNFGIGSTKLITADGEVSAAGVRTRIYMVHIISSGGGAAVVSFKNNGASGTTYLTETGTVSTGKTFIYGEEGVFFPNGCYVDVDANTTSVAVTYHTEV